MCQLKRLRHTEVAPPAPSSELFDEYGKLELYAESKDKSPDTFYWLCRAAQVTGVTVLWWLKAAIAKPSRSTN